MRSDPYLPIIDTSSGHRGQSVPVAETMVTVEDVAAIDGGTTTIKLRLPTCLIPPLAPASLYDGEHRLIDLDAVVHVGSGEGVFRTRQAPPTEAVGRTYRLQQWWRPDQLDAVTDVGRQWARTPAPSPDHHEHCLLDWATIETPGGHSEGWRSDDDWLCDACYLRYIVADELGVRTERRA